MKLDQKSKLIKRLKIIEGQVRGVQNMVEQDAYCIDVTAQSSAIKQALSGIEDVLLENHLSTCVVDFASGRAEIHHDGKVDWQKLKQEVEKLGKYKILPSDLTACKECGLLYSTARQAARCEQWCAAHHSCNLEIIKNSLTQ